MLPPLCNHYPGLTNIKTWSIMFNLYLDTLSPPPSFWGNPRKITLFLIFFICERFLQIYLLTILLNFYFDNSILGLLKFFLISTFSFFKLDLVLILQSITNFTGSIRLKGKNLLNLITVLPLWPISGLILILLSFVHRVPSHLELVNCKGNWKL